MTKTPILIATVVLVLSTYASDDDKFLSQGRNRLNAVHARQSDVHDHDVGPVRAKTFHRLFAFFHFGNQFDVDEGTLFFDLAQPMNPNINATLTTEKPMQSGDSSTRETITLTVTGRAQEPDVNLTSSPTGLSQTEIAQLLTFGQIRGGGAGAARGGSSRSSAPTAARSSGCS